MFTDFTDIFKNFTKYYKINLRKHNLRGKIIFDIIGI
jgi:uncharacterized membrane protein YesL